MAIIIFDFDDTLFDTKRFNNDVIERFVVYGVDEGLARQAYHDTKIQTGNYNLADHINIIQNLNNTEIPKDFHDWFESLDLTSYVLPQSTEMLNNLAQDHTLLLLSKGKDDFQNLKINRSNLAKHFNEIHITPDEKEIFLTDKIFNDKVIFINDKENENNKISIEYPHFQIVHRHENIKAEDILNIIKSSM
ncbi:HAD hydrolase-like protein [Candidatus Nomurabacteria bacterium]|nr:HAD hydrolase-like protein [Candidatus Nomurabacteria bacterium]